MNKTKKKLVIAVLELILVVMVFTTGTFAFFSLRRTVSLDNINVRVQTINEIFVKEADDIGALFSQVLTFNTGEDYEKPEITTVDGINFFRRDGSAPECDECLIKNDFTFFANSNFDVYLKPEEPIFTTTETEDGKDDVVKVLRMGFIEYEVIDGEKVFQGPPILIYAKEREETFVAQDPNFQDAHHPEICISEDPCGTYVQNFTRSDLDTTKLFSLQAGVEKNIRIVIWLEGNDPDSLSKIAEASYSVNIVLEGR